VRSRIRGLLAVPFALGLLMSMPVAAQAQPTQEGSGFGRHVSLCAQMMGFSADHNPGMHQGAHGWNGESC